MRTSIKYSVPFGVYGRYRFEEFFILFTTALIAAAPDTANAAGLIQLSITQFTAHQTPASPIYTCVPGTCL